MSHMARLQRLMRHTRDSPAWLAELRAIQEEVADEIAQIVANSGATTRREVEALRDKHLAEFAMEFALYLKQLPESGGPIQ